MKTGGLITAWRKRAKMTQEELADAAGMGRSRVADCEGDRASPTVRTLLRLIDAIERRFVPFGEEENERLAMFFLGPDEVSGSLYAVHHARKGRKP